jgi:hypothetical protein
LILNYLTAAVEKGKSSTKQDKVISAAPKVEVQEDVLAEEAIAPVDGDAELL